MKVDDGSNDSELHNSLTTNENDGVTLKIKTSIGRIKYEFLRDDTMIRCDCTYRRNRSITYSQSAVYHHKRDNNDKKSKNRVLSHFW